VQHLGVATTFSKDDPVDAFTHDHLHLSELVLAVRHRLAALASSDTASTRDALVGAVERLRDELLTHFALEEEGLFPFVAAKRPELAKRAAALEAGHDAVCGSVSRLLYLAQRPGKNVDACRAIFERFEHGYAMHAQDEVAFLRDTSAKLDAADRAELRVLLAGL
jgi:iron-sulfur cluster repair protein YtfE (RIC family)